MKQMSLIILFFGIYLDVFSFPHVAPLPPNMQDSSYWQQQTDYKIDVVLNDEINELNGNIHIAYKNNSPDVLAYIWFHLWPNAYKDDGTAFAQQQLENKSTDFYFARKRQRGYIDSLSFMVDGEKVRVETDPKHADIVKVLLNSPLQSGQTITITTPFNVKIPDSFSRLGHVGQSYQITQWYPKPAVYDRKGWHPMPYLDQGEFYSEYGSFDVAITLPRNYVVGATGDLQDESEVAWLAQKAAETARITDFDEKDLSFPPSSIDLKTLHYKQNNIHDFAWFADKRFHVLKDEAVLPVSKRKVDIYALFTNQEANLWRKGAVYVRNAVLFYSEHVGEYPYKQCTAVQSALSAGAGMEYPNVTVIGLSRSQVALETVIVHEVGHNWFYGQLGSNEREHPWMDEGINSYYERRYIQYFHPNATLFGDSAGKALRLLGMGNLTSDDQFPLLYLFSARTGSDQPIELPAEKYAPINYGTIVYAKTAVAFRYLEKYLGTAKFDQIMQQYYRQYEFKHPYPEDLRHIFEANTPQNLEWFFDELLKSNHKLDYKIAKVVRKKEKIANTTYDQLTIKQHLGNVRGPYTISAFKNDSLVKTVWYDGFNGKMDILFPTGDFDRYELDTRRYAPDLYRQNNTYKFGLCHRPCKPQLRLLGTLENPERKQIFWFPAIAYNTYDKTMLGVALYSSFLPARRVQWQIMPLFATGTNTLAGTGKISLQHLGTNKFWNNLSVSVGANYFGTGYFSVYSKDTSLDNKLVRRETAKYLRLNTLVQYSWNGGKNPSRSDVNNAVWLRHAWINHSAHERDNPDLYNYSSALPYLADWNLKQVLEIGFSAKNTRLINPYSLQIDLQQLIGNQNATLVQVEAKYRFTYNSPRKGFDIRLYAGGFLKATQHAYQLSLADRGRYDYSLDDFYIGRFEQSGLWSKQVAMRQGGFKVPLNLGYSDKYLLAMNLKSGLPLRKIPIKLYADFALPIPDPANYWEQQIGGRFFADAGIAITPLPDVFEIYIPLLHSKNIQTSFDAQDTKFYEKISFMLNINKLNPFKKINQIATLF